MKRINSIYRIFVLFLIIIVGSFLIFCLKEYIIFETEPGGE